MSYYGNILTVYQASEATIEEVIRILETYKTIFARKETTFFVETTSKVNTMQVIDALTSRGIVFTFFHNHNPDGSRLRANAIKADFVKLVDDILFSQHFQRKTGANQEVIS